MRSRLRSALEARFVFSNRVLKVRRHSTTAANFRPNFRHRAIDSLHKGAIVVAAAVPVVVATRTWRTRFRRLAPSSV